MGLRLAGYGRTGHAHTGIFRLQLKGSLAIFIYVLFRVSMIYNPASTSRILNFSINAFTDYSEADIDEISWNGDEWSVETHPPVKGVCIGNSLAGWR